MAHNNYSLKYRTFNQLLEDVTVDFKNYALEGLIEPQTLIKVARRCNYDLGLRIYKTRQAVIEVFNGKAKLPDDFYILNFAMVCTDYTVTEALPQGTHIEERLVAPDYTCYPDQPQTCKREDPCNTPINECSVDPCTGTCLTRCGEEYQAVQIIKKTTRTYRIKHPLNITDNAPLDCEDCTSSLEWELDIPTGKIQSGWLLVNFDTGNVYINYMGDMVDEEGNLLVPDHEILNEYYEYALKERILENMIWNDIDGNIGNKYQLVVQKLRMARNNAKSLVNTPNFKELQKIWRANRKAQYHNYYNMFKSHWPLSYKRY